MKKTVSEDFRNGYLLGLASCEAERFINSDVRKQFTEAFDKMYKVDSITLSDVEKLGTKSIAERKNEAMQKAHRNEKSKSSSIIR